MPKVVWGKSSKAKTLNSLANRSRRAYEFSQAEAQVFRKRIFLILGVLILLYGFYLVFYSQYFKLTTVKVKGQVEGLSSEEIQNSASGYLQSGKGFWPKNNFFLIRLEEIRKFLQGKYLLVDLELKKEFPRSLTIQLKQKLSRLVWSTGEVLYILELNGSFSAKLEARELINAGVPVIYDLTNSPVVLSQSLVNQRLVSLILEIYQNFESYQLPALELAYFRVDGPTANYVKIVTKQGLEIHVNYLNSLSRQMAKLQKSLAAGKLDLSKTSYINLRIENQVIYK